MPGNPLRRPKPTDHETIVRERFHLATPKGNHVERQYVDLHLTRDQLWVSDQLSIPLANVTNLGLSKRGGFVEYYDPVALCEQRLDFTKVGFLRYKQRVVRSFLEHVQNALAAARAATGTANGLSKSDILGCEVCGTEHFDAYVFYDLRFVGFAPIAYSFRLTPDRHVLCSTHAREKCLAKSTRTAIWGYWGFPGCLAAPWYVGRNLLALAARRTLDVKTALITTLAGIILPVVLVGALFVGLWVSLIAPNLD